MKTEESYVNVSNLEHLALWSKSGVQSGLKKNRGREVELKRGNARKKILGFDCG